MSRTTLVPRFHTTLCTILAVSSICGRATGEEDERSACATTAEIAQELRAAHKLKEAREKLVECARPSCPDIVRQDCSQWLSEVNAILPSLLIRATGTNVTAVRTWSDGELSPANSSGDAIAVNPGERHLHFEADGMVPLDLQVTVSEGEIRRPITVVLVPLQPDAPPLQPISPAKPSPISTALPYAIAGVGAVALGGFMYFGIKGKSEANDLAAGCGATKSCSESQVDPVRQQLLIADISLGISLVSLGAATWMFIARGSTKPKEPAAVQVGVTPGSGLLKVNLQF